MESVPAAVQLYVDPRVRSVVVGNVCISKYSMQEYLEYVAFILCHSNHSSCCCTSHSTLILPTIILLFMPAIFSLFLSAVFSQLLLAVLTVIVGCCYCPFISSHFLQSSVCRKKYRQ